MWLGHFSAQGVYQCKRPRQKRSGHVKMKELLIFMCIFHATKSLDNGLGRTPQMGWNSWNHFRCAIDSQLVMEIADAFVCINYRLLVT